MTTVDEDAVEVKIVEISVPVVKAEPEPEPVIEVDAAEISKKLNTIVERISSAKHVQDGLIVARLMTDSDTEMPFISVISTAGVDPFLRDAAAVRLCVGHVDGASEVGCVVVSSLGREIVACREADALDACMDDLVRARYRCCEGFADGMEGTEVFERARKIDLPNVLIEKYDGRVLHRARKCRYAIDGDDEKEKEHRQCEQCRRIHAELDEKYCGGRVTGGVGLVKPEIKPEIKLEGVVDPESSQEPKKRKRGRPKGSRNRPQYFSYGRDYIDPSEVAGLNPITEDDDVDEENCENAPPPKKEIKFEAEEVGGEDDPTDADYGKNALHLTVRKSGRRARRASKAVLLELMRRRKRGRPPIITDPTACKYCGKVFIVLRDYKAHVLTHTAQFECPLEDCLKRFRSQNDLDVHLRRHRGEKPYVCSICAGTFSMRSDFKEHMKSHSGERPFPCGVCSKSFAREQQRKIHMVTHTGIKAYLCPECGNSFGSASTLIDHRKRKHLEMRDHKCEECQKGFFTRQELEAHERTHTGIKPYACELCGKAFSRTHHLKRHISGIHKAADSKVDVNLAVARSVKKRAAGAVTVGGTTATVGGTLTIGGETVLVTTENENAVLVGGSIIDGSGSGGEVVQAEYIVEDEHGNKYSAALDQDGNPVLMHKIEEASDDAATSLIELSQSQDDAGTVDTVVEISGDPTEEQYILVTTTDDGQKLVPLSQYSQFVEKQDGEDEEVTDIVVEEEEEDANS